MIEKGEEESNFASAIERMTDEELQGALQSEGEGWKPEAWEVIRRVALERSGQPKREEPLPTQMDLLNQIRQELHEANEKLGTLITILVWILILGFVGGAVFLFVTLS